MRRASGQASFAVSSTEFVTLSHFEIVAGGSYRVIVDVAAGAFACRSHKLSFDGLREFAEKIRRAYEALEGQAELKYHYEPDYIKVEFKSRGHVIVSGLLGAANPRGCSLKFAIEADQTFLDPFIAQLEAISRELHPSDAG